MRGFRPLVRIAHGLERSDKRRFHNYESSWDSAWVWEREWSFSKKS